MHCKILKLKKASINSIIKGILILLTITLSVNLNAQTKYEEFEKIEQEYFAKNMGVYFSDSMKIERLLSFDNKTESFIENLNINDFDDDKSLYEITKSKLNQYIFLNKLELALLYIKNENYSIALKKMKSSLQFSNYYSTISHEQELLQLVENYEITDETENEFIGYILFNLDEKMHACAYLKKVKSNKFISQKNMKSYRLYCK